MSGGGGERGSQNGRPIILVIASPVLHKNGHLFLFLFFLHVFTCPIPERSSPLPPPCKTAAWSLPPPLPPPPSNVINGGCYVYVLLLLLLLLLLLFCFVQFIILLDRRRRRKKSLLPRHTTYTGGSANAFFLFFLKKAFMQIENCSRTTKLFTYQKTTETTFFVTPLSNTLVCFSKLYLK